MPKLLCIALLFALAACTNSPVGFGKAGPNEFLIITYPPLTVPPNISMRAPQDPKVAAELKTSLRANKILFGVPKKYARSLSGAERALLKKIGTDKALPNIRRLIAEDRGLAAFDDK